MHRRFRSSAEKIAATLEQIEADPDLIDRLTQRGYQQNEPPAFNVDHWVSQQNQGNNLWRLKLLELQDRATTFRVIYVFVASAKDYYVLAVVNRREFDYEPEHPITIRILTAIKSL